MATDREQKYPARENCPIPSSFKEKKERNTSPLSSLSATLRKCTFTGYVENKLYGKKENIKPLRSGIHKECGLRGKQTSK
jgi:hypothetical protein